MNINFAISNEYLAVREKRSVIGNHMRIISFFLFLFLLYTTYHFYGE